MKTRPASLFLAEDSVLDRLGPSPFNFSLTSFQQKVDESVSHFVENATDWRSIAAMMAGGLAYRWGKVGVMGLEEGMSATIFWRTPLRALAITVGLTAEVGAFEFTNRALLSLPSRAGLKPAPTPSVSHLSSYPHLWSWSGQGGLQQGLLSSLVTFATLKTFGTLTEGQNIIVQHGAQDLGMVLGHQLVGRILQEKPEGDWGEQLLHAEAMNLQLDLGMELGHLFTGGRFLALEKGLDLPSSSRLKKAPALGLKNILRHMALNNPLTWLFLGAGGVGGCKGEEEVEKAAKADSPTALEELSKSIREHPEGPWSKQNDSHWRVMGDFLQEQGDIRGELIAIDFELEGASPEKREELEQQKMKLEKTLTDSLGVMNDRNKFEWRRGFLERVTIGPHHIFLLHRIFQLEEWRFLRGLRLTGGSLHHLQSILGLPLMVAITDLDLSGGRMGVEGVKALTTSPYLQNLTVLNLENNRIGIIETCALANSPRLKNLMELDLTENQLGNQGAIDLANSPHLQNLRKLDLDYNHIGPQGAQALANSSTLQNLIELNFSLNSIGDVGVRALANSPHLRNLTRLELGKNEIGFEGAQALANSSVLQNLIQLGLEFNRIGDEGARALMESPHLLRLKRLTLFNNEITEPTRQELSTWAEKRGIKLEIEEITF